MALKNVDIPHKNADMALDVSCSDEKMIKMKKIVQVTRLKKYASYETKNVILSHLFGMFNNLKYP